MAELKVHARTCNAELMVQSSDLRKAFVLRLKQALASANVAEWGAGAYLAKIAGTTAKASSKWLNEESMPGRANMKEIARQLGVRVEWLQHGEGQMRESDKDIYQVKESNVIAADFSVKPERAGELSIPQFNVRGAMGAGQLANDYVEIIRHVTMDRAHLDMLGITFTSPANLAIITGWGQSMATTINHGEPVFVDRGVSSFTGDGIYVFTWDDLVYIKRLQKESKTHFKVISDNRDHDPFMVPIAEVTIHARALLAWNARKL